jgi:hypothetical protein
VRVGGGVRVKKDQHVPKLHQRCENELSARPWISTQIAFPGTPQ